MSILIEGCITCHPELFSYLNEPEAIVVDRVYLNDDGQYVPGAIANVTLNELPCRYVRAVNPGKWAVRLSEPLKVCGYTIDHTAGISVYLDQDDYQVTPHLTPV